MALLTPVRKSKLSSIQEGKLYRNTCTNLRLVRSGLEFFELLEDMIQKATKLIHLQVYIFAEDETGRRIANALISAAKRNVKVYIIVDGYASQGLSDKFIGLLKRSGISFRYFDPVLKSKYFYFGRRLHHKIITVDNQALVGGINISNHYNDTFTNVAWLDWALYIEGYAVTTLRSICRKRVLDYDITSDDDLLKYHPHAGYCPVTVNVNDWVRGKREITKNYQEMLSTATEEVTIMSSYFIPGKIIRKHLKAAANRGVRIRVIVGDKSDVRMAKYAEKHMYRWMLENNIEIYEYQPRILHAKIATCDNHWLTVGSYNINNISAYASIELNIEIKNENFVKHVHQRIEKIRLSECRQVSLDELKKTNIFFRFLQRSAYDIFRFVLFLFTFYFKEHKGQDSFR